MTPAGLHVRTYRQGEPGHLPVVLLHGFPFDSRMWDDVAARVTVRGAVLAVDLPGLGGSPLATGTEPSLERSADLVAAALAARGVVRAAVVGLSMGGYVALALLERHPDLVAALGLLDTTSAADQDGPRANRLRIAGEVEASGTVEVVRPMVHAVLGASSVRSRPELAVRLGRLVDEQAPAGVAWSQRAMAGRPDRTAALRAFAGPALVLVGDGDEVTPLAAAERMRSALTGAELVVVPRSGHMSAVEQPAAVALAVDDLLRRAPTARR